MNELNKDQKRAAKFKDGVCAVIAVPGSGKTRTMIERIGILVNEHLIINMENEAYYSFADQGIIKKIYGEID